MPSPSGRTILAARRQALPTISLALVVWGLGANTALAPVPNYSIRNWQTEDGLPQNSVTAIVQTQDGYLWLGTYSGLVRFDGARFTVFDSDNTPSLKNPRITSLFEDAGGSLWIGHETGDLTRLQFGIFQPVEFPGGWSGGKIVRIAADEIGELWLMNKDGLLGRLRDGRVFPTDKLRGPLLVTMVRDARGNLWVVREGELSRVERGELAPVQPGNTLARFTVDALCPSRDGGLWVVSLGRLYNLKAGALSEAPPAAPGVFDRITALEETRAGQIVVGTAERGLYLLTPGGPAQHLGRTNGLAQDWIACFCVDREDNVWVGSGNGGLSALRPVSFERVNPPDKWNGMAVKSVSLGSSGSLWVGTEGAGLYRFQDGCWKQFGDQEGLTSRFIWSALEDAQGRLWVGSWAGGLFVRRGDRFEIAPGLEGVRTPMPALLLGHHGDLWIGTGSGLLHYEEGKTTWYGREQGLMLPDVRAVLEDAKGTLWFGMNGGGLGCLKQGNVKQYLKSHGLVSDFVLCLHQDSAGALWIGTGGGGLNRLKDGRFAKIGVREGLPRKVICNIEDDGCGDFWMSTEGGIVRASQSELNRCANSETNRVGCRVYGLGDGLETIDCSGGFQPAGCKTADGRLWFPTRKGLVTVDPANLRTNALPPPVIIEELLVDGQVQSPKSKVQSHAENVRTDSAFLAPQFAFLEIPPGRHYFEFRYTALSFAAPEKVQFKYRLEGLEPDWVDAQTKRSVPYDFLAPGDYRFRVIACNNDEVWNEEGASVRMTVLPFVWQTWWFRTLSYLAGAALVGGVVLVAARRRHRRKLEALERQRALERERARIAKDIHDDLGASLTHITMLTQSAHKDLEHPEQTAGHLDDIYSTARGLTRALDEIVWAVNPKHDTLDSLATYFARFAQEFLIPAGIRCRLDMPVQLPSWPLTAEVRHNLFLAFKEALHNVVRHAAASEVRISLAPNASAFALCVEDNGKGFQDGQASAPAAPNGGRLAGGNGLGNMRRRMEEVGGACAIHSSPGKGTKVEFVVNVRSFAMA